ncbi:MAG: MBOAT family protein [Ruminococcus sp.]|jgi:alginate O-acetyltransferase complex protein AlgI|nr:MBOAT family protein [Ruminococcus sp.]MBR4022254.1 MBOAT family protein [Ruminococcus sp.]MBR6645948.1 MBOAT family protein [Clostridia bacterium]
MLFSAITFLYFYLPVTVLIYFIAPKPAKNAVLLLGSLFFYGWGEPKYLILMVISIIQGYVLGLLIDKSKRDKKEKLSKLYISLSVVLSLGTLGYFKYADFFIENFNRVTGLSMGLLKIALPIGISFYTFQILSYTIDVYRRNVDVQKNIIDFGAYVAMFPQLIAGPIVRYADIAVQLKNRTHSIAKSAEGIRRFIIGLSKKVLLANILGELAEAYRTAEDKSVLFVWLYAIAYTLHIYFDFSGYSDMAIGLGKIFGFDFPENFNYPYISKSVTEFWRRWHMSLGTWFRDYLYIPLGGNRVSKPRWMINILIVWLATGFWHGAAWNFIIWGLYFAILLMLEKLFLLKITEKLKGINHIYVLLLVIISFVIFDSLTMNRATNVIGEMFFMKGLPLTTQESVYLLRSYAVIIITGIIGATPIPKKLVLKLREIKAGAIVTDVAEPFLLVSLLAVVTAFLVDGSFNPFLYFRF